MSKNKANNMICDAFVDDLILKSSQYCKDLLIDLFTALDTVYCNEENKYDKIILDWLDGKLKTMLNTIKGDLFS